MFKKIKSKTKEYKPYEYWVKRGEKYQQNYVETKDRIKQETELMKYFEKLSFESVMEFGCGFGRMTKLVLEKFPIKKYLAIDLSSDQIENARNNCKKFDFIDFRICTINDLKIDEKFDLVFGTNVLLHVPPMDIKLVVQKLKNITKKNMVHLDWYPLKKPERIASHNFVHPYPEIYQQIDNLLDVNMIRISDEQCIFDVNFVRS